MNDIKKNYKTYNVKGIQPYVVCCGALNQPQCYHAVIDNVVYDFPGIIKAVEFIYKTLFVLKIPYPCGSPHFYTFLQFVVYDMQDFRAGVSKASIKKLKGLFCGPETDPLEEKATHDLQAYSIAENVELQNEDSVEHEIFEQDADLDCEFDAIYVKEESFTRR